MVLICLLSKQVENYKENEEIIWTLLLFFIKNDSIYSKEIVFLKNINIIQILYYSIHSMK